MSKVTTELLKKIFPGTPVSKLSRFVAPFNEILPQYEVNDKKRFAAFIANVGIESDRLKTTKEYGGDSYFLKYNGRKDLGNVIAGDGPRYKGRSVLQTTGRYNYWRVVVAYLRVITGKDWSNTGSSDFSSYLKSKSYDNLLKEADKYNVNFLANPELLEEFPHCVEAAGVFIKDNNLNNYADKGQFSAYAGVLNRGSAKKKALHYDERKAIYDLAMRVIPDNFNLTTSKLVEKTGLSEPLTKEEIGEPLSTEGIENGNNHGVTAPPPSLIPVVTSVIEVEQVTAAPEEPKSDEKPDVAVSIGNKVAAVWSVIASTVIAIVTFLTSTPLGIAISIIGAVALVGAIYMIINWRRNENKEKREAADKLELTRLETELKLKREQQAFELQKLTLESAMRKDLNTVRLVPPPTEMPNSDNEGK